MWQFQYDIEMYTRHIDIYYHISTDIIIRVKSILFFKKIRYTEHEYNDIMIIKA